MTEEVKDLFIQIEQFNKIDAIPSEGWDEWIKKSDIADENLLKFLSHSKYGTKDLATYTQYLKDQNKVIDLQTIKVSTLNAAKNIGLSIGTAIVGSLAIKGLQQVITAIDNYIHAEEKIREAAEAAKASVKEINDALSNSVNTVDKARETYSELADKVGNLGTLNQNQGNLSADEYQEFLDINNQLAELFPQLTIGYNENGDALLSLSGDITTITETLDGLIKKEQELANYEIAEKLPEIWDGYVSNAEQLKTDLNSAISAIDYCSSALEKINSKGEQVGNNMMDPYYLNTSDEANENTIIRDYLSAAGLNWENYYKQISNNGNNQATVYAWDFSELKDEQIEEINSYFNSFVAEYNRNADYAKNQIKGNNEELSAYLNSWLKTDWTYSNSGDMQQTISAALLNINYMDILPEDLKDKGFDEGVSEWIKKNIISSITAIDNEEVLQAIIDIFTQNLAGEEYRTKVQLILDYDANNDNVDFSPWLNDDILSSTDTQLSIDEFVNRIASIRDIDLETDFDGKRMIESFVSQFDADERTLLMDIEIPDDAKDWLLEDWQNWADENIENFKLDAAIETPFDVSSPLSSIEDAFSGLDSIYENIQNGTTVTADSLAALNDAFGELDGGTALQEFKDVLTTMPDDTEAQKEALNKLATAYLDNSELMENLNEDNAEYVKSELTKMGVTNADEVVQSRLGVTTQSLADAQTIQQSILENVTDSKQRAAIESINLQDATLDDINALINEANTLGLDNTALVNYAKQLIASGKVTLTTDGSIKNLNSLIDALLGSSEYSETWALLQEAVSRNDIAAVKEYSKKLKSLKKSAKIAYNGANKNTVVEYNAPTSTSTGSGSPGSSSDTSKSTIDWIDRRLTRIQEKVEKIKTTISHWFDFKQKNTRLDKSIKLLQSSMSTQEKAYEEYMSEAYVYYTKIKKEFGEEYAKKIASLVRDGGINISEYSGEGAEWIQSLMDYYDKAQDALDARQESLAAIYEAGQQKLENITTYYDSYKDYTKSLIDLQESALDFRETSGKSMVNGEQLNIYKTEKSLYEKELAQIQKEYAAYKAELDSQYKSGYITTEDYNAGLKYLRELNTEANELKISIAETQKAINEIDFKKIEIALDKASRSATAISEAIDLVSAKNSRITERDTMTVNGEEKTIYKYYQDQLKYLAQEKARYQEEIEWYSKQLKTVEENSQDWIDWTEAIADAQSSINELGIEQEEIYDDMIQLILNGYDEIADRLNNYKSALSGLSELLTDDMLLKDDGLLTDYGVAKITMLSREYETASASLKNYGSELNRIDAMYKANAAGYSDEEDYLEDRQEAIENIISSMSDMQSLTSELISLRKSQYDKELAALDKIIDARKEAYDKKKEYYDYDKSIRSKTKDIQSLEAQIAAIEATGDSLEKRKQLLELQQELNDAQTELAETRTEHTYNIIIDGLDEFRDDLSDSYDAQIAYLKSSFEAQNSVIEEVTELWTSCSDLVNSVIKEIGETYGVDTFQIIASTGKDNLAKFADGHIETVSKTPQEIKDTLVKVSLDESLPAPELAGLALATVDIMPELVKLPDYSNIPVSQGPTINCDYQTNIYIEGNADQNTVMDIKKLMPSITKELTKSLANDLHKSGW